MIQVLEILFLLGNTYLKGREGVVFIQAQELLTAGINGTSLMTHHLFLKAHI